MFPHSLLQIIDSVIVPGLGPPFPCMDGGLGLCGVEAFVDREKSSLSLAYSSFTAGRLGGGVMMAGGWGTTPLAFFARSAIVAR